MKGYRNYILIAVLLALSALPFIVPMSLFVGQQLTMHIMKERLEVASLHTVRMAKNDIRWVTKNTECIIEGRMFDVKSSTESDGQVILSGLYDDDETQIVRLLESSNESGKNNIPIQLIYGYTHLIAVENIQPQVTFLNNKQNSDWKTDHETCMLSTFNVVLSPPPDLL